MHNKIFVWIAFATGLLLSIPLIAMQFTNEVNWTLSDFIVMGSLLLFTATAFVLAARKFPSHRLLIAVATLVAFLWIWAELAVGVFTNWGS